MQFLERANAGKPGKILFINIEDLRGDQKDLRQVTVLWIWKLKIIATHYYELLL